MPSEGTSRSQIIPRGFAPGEATLDNDTSAERFGGSPIALDQHTASSSRSGQDPFATGPSTPRTPYDYDTAEFGAGNSRRMSSQINSAPHGPSSWSEGNRRPGLGTYAPGRTSSLKRKPVPSLGPELRTEFGQQTSGTEVRRQSYQIFPDPPLNQGD